MQLSLGDFLDFHALNGILPAGMSLQFTRTEKSWLTEHVEEISTYGKYVSITLN
jgi:hypothetical protein